jgi:hypothetical protein
LRRASHKTPPLFRVPGSSPGSETSSDMKVRGIRAAAPPPGEPQSLRGKQRGGGVDRFRVGRLLDVCINGRQKKEAEGSTKESILSLQPNRATGFAGSSQGIDLHTKLFHEAIECGLVLLGIEQKQGRHLRPVGNCRLTAHV